MLVNAVRHIRSAFPRGFRYVPGSTAASSAGAIASALYRARGGRSRSYVARKSRALASRMRGPSRTRSALRLAGRRRSGTAAWRGRRRRAPAITRTQVLRALQPPVEFRDTFDQTIATGMAKFGPDHVPASFGGILPGRAGYVQDRWFDQTMLSSMQNNMFLQQTPLMPTPTNEALASLYSSRKMTVSGYAKGRIANTSSGRIKVIMWHVTSKRKHDYTAVMPPDDTLASIGNGGSPLVFAQKLLFASASGVFTGGTQRTQSVFYNDVSFFKTAIFRRFFHVRRLRVFVLEHGQATDFSYKMKPIRYDQLDSAEEVGGSLLRGEPNRCQYIIWRLDGQAAAVSSGTDPTAAVTTSTAEATCAISTTKFMKARMDPSQTAQYTDDLYGRVHATPANSFVQNQFGTAASKLVEFMNTVS